MNFRCNGAFDEFTSASVDGNTLNKDSYDVYEGSTVIDLEPSYMDNLDIGSHTLTFTYENGESATARFQVQSLDDPLQFTVATTGDRLVLIGLVFALLISSLIAFVVLRRQKNK